MKTYDSSTRQFTATVDLGKDREDWQRYLGFVLNETGGKVRGDELSDLEVIAKIFAISSRHFDHAYDPKTGIATLNTRGKFQLSGEGPRWNFQELP